MRAGRLFSDGAQSGARWHLFAVGTIVLLAVLAYLQPVFDTGWYYDDWSNFAAFQDAPNQTLTGLFSECRIFDPADRPGACIYFAGSYWVIGSHIKGYHLLAIVLLATCAVLLYALLTRCRMPRTVALLVALLFVLYPGSDATRLWPTAGVGQYALSVYLAGLLLGIYALQRHGRAAAAAHTASIAAFVLMFFTYENLIPAIAMSGIFYWLALRRLARPVLLRGGVDLALALSFVIYRFVLAPVDSTSGFVVERSFAETLARAGDVMGTAWTSWHTLFVPTTFVLVALAAGSVVAAWSFWRDRDARRGMLRWLGVAVIACLVAAASLVAYVPAHDLYLPQTSGTFNRLNLVPAGAYVVLFVAVLGVFWHALRARAGDVGARLGLGLVVLAVAINLVTVSRDSQEAWAESWRAQGQALNSLRAMMPAIPDDATIFTFGHPIYERGFVPVFAASWDIRGAIDYETPNDPPAAAPFQPGVACGAQGVVSDGQLLARYRGEHPMWFVNTASSEARPVRSFAACTQATVDWGLPPFWGRTITDPSL